MAGEAIPAAIPLHGEAESSLAAAERLGHIHRPCQQRDARVYLQRGRDAVLAVASIDQMTHMAEVAPRRAYPEVAPRRAMTS